MAGAQERDGGGHRGGIAALAMTVAQHGRALEYDLMTRTRYGLDDMGGELNERMLLAFVMHLPSDSALSSEVRGDSSEEIIWQEPALLPMLLAEAVDTMHVISWEVAQANSRRDLGPRYPEPIERPGAVKRHDTHVYGSDPIPISEFDAWWNGG